ncbi:MAG TPA: AbrB/MazE/SpoVT family DNA-binding domain-containing protein [Terriglobales bacterium]|nr:AbrB/MazE/SpoVT family DNA-binding domain-containing protein [Terriglobales bacterium]
MVIARSRITAQGQITVPAEVRRRLGVEPGAELEWSVEDHRLMVRRASRFSSEEIHRRLFPAGPPRRRSLEEMEAGIGKAVRARDERSRH